MTGYITHIEKETLENESFRKVLFTSHYSQLVVMNLKPGEEIGEEVHGLDQFIRIEKGNGKAILDGVEHVLEAEWAVVIPAGTLHNIINVSDSQELKLYTIYSPPEHRDGVIHVTKRDVREEHFDGHVSTK
jgi:mannose-6-phosphate isomerase-like protein (cupin superfamily)